MKRTLTFALAALMLVSVAGCKKEEAPAPAAPAVAPAAPVADAAAAPAADAAAPAADAAAPAADAAAPAAPAAGAEIEKAADAIAAAIEPPGIPAPADVAAPPADAIKTASGLAYKKLTVNESGRPIVADDIVRLHYTGWTTDGKMFDSSIQRGEPAVFIPNHLIDGMKEAMTLAKSGEKIRAWVPEELAYKGRPGAPSGMLVFDFDIMDVLTPTMPPKDIPADAVKLPNGLAYRITNTVPGAATIAESDLVMLEFSGWTQADGKRFQTSAEMGEPLAAPVNSMFPAWREILPKGHVGDVMQMWIPQELGIDKEGAELKGTLIFEVTIKDAKKMPAAPADVAAPPADAQKTESGIAWKILTPGTGTEHPTATSVVKVHYSGWTTDGVMFDSSIPRGEAIEFPLNAVIPGWTESVQLMVVGEKRLVWIPEELAYKGQPGAPQGMLVFEIELLEIK